jgi:hypothetical protein
MSNKIKDEDTLKNYFSGGKMPNESNFSDLITTMVGHAKVPSTPTSKGTKGTWAYDGTYLYWCIETNVWIRTVIISDW